jgi:outer membrane protein assembly factor BamD (BamD/ComL family)
MGDLLEFRNSDADRQALFEAIANLKYLIQVVPESEVKTSFLLHLEEYEARLHDST